MPYLDETLTPTLTPEEEYLLGLEALAAEPVPPPPASPSMAGPPPAEPVSTAYSNPDIVTTTYPSSGSPAIDLRSISTGQTGQALPATNYTDTSMYYATPQTSPVPTPAAYPAAPESMGFLNEPTGDPAIIAAESAVPLPTPAPSWQYEPGMYQNPAPRPKPAIAPPPSVVDPVANALGYAVGGLLRPLANSFGQTIGNVLNTDPEANRRAVAELAGNVANTDTAANRRAFTEPVAATIDNILNTDVAANRLAASRLIREKGPIAIISHLAGEALPFIFDRSEKESLLGLTGEPYGPMSNTGTWRRRQDEFGRMVSEFLPSPPNLDEALANIDLGQVTGMIPVPRYDTGPEDILAHEQQLYPIFGSGLVDKMLGGDTVLNTVGQMKSVGLGYQDVPYSDPLIFGVPELEAGTTPTPPRGPGDTEDFDAFINTPLPTVNGQEPGMNSLTARALLAGFATGEAIRTDQLPMLATTALVNLARNESIPEPVRGEAYRLIGSRLADEVEKSWQERGLDTVRQGLQTVRLLAPDAPAIPAPPEATFPDVTMPNVTLPDVSLPDLSGVRDAVAAASAATEQQARGARLAETLRDAPIQDVLRGGVQGLGAMGIPSPDASILDRGLGAVRDVAGRAESALPDVNLPSVTLPNVTLPDVTLPSLPGGGEPARVTDTATRPAATLAPEVAAGWRAMETPDIAAMLEKNSDEFNTTVKGIAVLDPDGTPRKVWIVPGMEEYVTTPNGERVRSPYIVGVVVDGETVPAGREMTPEEFGELLRSADAAPADAVPAPEAAATAPAADTGTTTTGTAGDATGLTLEDVSVPAPAGTGGGSSGRSSGGGSSGRSSGGGSSGRSSGGGYERSYNGGYDRGGDSFNRGYEREFTADDFMDAAGGNRRKAEFMARAANRRRRRGGGAMSSGGMGGFWEGFPFNRPPSPIRELILRAIAESQSASRDESTSRRR